MIRILIITLTAVGLAACGRMGAPLRPEQGVIIMKPDDKPAAPKDDSDFILDPLL